MEVAQSIPGDLPGPSRPWTSTYMSWLKAIQAARQTIDIACYYMTLTDGASAPPGQGGYMGQDIFNALIAAANNYGVRIRIVQQKPAPNMPDYDSQNLTRLAGATVRSLDFAQAMGGIGGILHTKFMVIDGTYAYIGSANYGA